MKRATKHSCNFQDVTSNATGGSRSCWSKLWQWYLSCHIFIYSFNFTMIIEQIDPVNFAKCSSTIYPCEACLIY